MNTTLHHYSFLLILLSSVYPAFAMKKESDAILERAEKELEYKMATLTLSALLEENSLNQTIEDISAETCQELSSSVRTEKEEDILLSELIQETQKETEENEKRIQERAKILALYPLDAKEKEKILHLNECGAFIRITVTESIGVKFTEFCKIGEGLECMTLSNRRDHFFFAVNPKKTDHKESKFFIDEYEKRSKETLAQSEQRCFVQFMNVERLKAFESLTLENVLVDEQDLLTIPQLTSLTLNEIDACVPDPDPTLSFKYLTHLGIGKNLTDEVINAILRRSPETEALTFVPSNGEAWRNWGFNISRLAIFSKIKMLDLQQNNIVSIENLAWLELKATSIDLSKNHISTLEAFSKMNAPCKLKLNLGDNPCTSLQPLQRYSQEGLTMLDLVKNLAANLNFTHLIKVPYLDRNRSEAMALYKKAEILSDEEEMTPCKK